MSQFFKDYENHVQERRALGVPPLALTADQAQEVVNLLQNIPAGKEEELLHLLQMKV